MERARFQLVKSNVWSKTMVRRGDICERLLVGAAVVTQTSV